MTFRPFLYLFLSLWFKDFITKQRIVSSFSSRWMLFVEKSCKKNKLKKERNSEYHLKA